MLLFLYNIILWPLYFVAFGIAYVYVLYVEILTRYFY